MSNILGRSIVYLLLIVVTGLSIFPFYWMTVISTHTAGEISSVPPAVFYGHELANNLSKIFKPGNINFLRSLGNSFFISTTITISMLFFSSLAGFAFARLKFSGKGIILLFILGTMMLPTQLGLIPQYIIMSKLHWINDFRAVIVPGMVSAFGVFFMRQYIDASIPMELMDAGRIDGCQNRQLYYKIVVPTIAPAFATLGILTYMAAWNDYLWPSVVLKSSAMLTVQVAITHLQTASYFQDKALTMVAATLATLPLFVIFLLFNRQFIAGITEGALKG